MVCTFELGRILVLVLHCYAVAVRELAERRRNGVALRCSVRSRVFLQLQSAAVVVEHSVVYGEGVAVAVEVYEVELALLVFVLIAEAVESALVGVEDHLCRVGSTLMLYIVESLAILEESAFGSCVCGCNLCCAVVRAPCECASCLVNSYDVCMIALICELTIA